MLMSLPLHPAVYLDPESIFSLPTTSIEWVFVGCAIVGGGVMLIQIVASLFGADHAGDHDFHGGAGDAHGGGAGSWISFRTVIAFLAFFGLGGMVGLSRDLGTLGSLAVALVCGVLALAITRVVMLQFTRLRSSGTVEIQNAVGCEARVYLTVPAAKSGQGSVTVGIQGRTMQFHAITTGAEIKTGALCKVSAVQAGDTLVVEPL